MAAADVGTFGGWRAAEEPVEMNKSRWWIAPLLLLAAAGSWIYWRRDGHQGPAYRFAPLERGDIEASVSATGALSAVTTVQVGTQVSGQIAEIYADFNDKVTKGELLARVDPVLSQQAVAESLAGLERAQAQFGAAKREYERNQKLFDQGLLPASELTGFLSTYEVAKANLTAAQVSLDRAKRNLEYTSIHSPIDGVIVERNVDVGQTVAASLSAPQLFLIANDLSRMQILASVGESDIGAIVEGQSVRFTVQSYPNRRFDGMVRQVRLQSKTTENVVNYTVVVAVDNKEGKLLPGMTATVDFLTGAARDVFLVPNAAIRFRPTEAMIAEVTAGKTPSPDGARGPGERRATAVEGAAPEGGAFTRGPRAGGFPGGFPAGGFPGGPFPPGASGARGRAGSAAVLWHLDAQGKLATLPVRLGLSDGQHTEVVGEGLSEGLQVIVAVQSADASAAGPTGTANPFQPAPQPGPRFRPGGF
jgi:HlyD family secretion protein